MVVLLHIVVSLMLLFCLRADFSQDDAWQGDSITDRSGERDLDHDKHQLVRAATRDRLTAPEGYYLSFDYDAEGRRFKKEVTRYESGEIVEQKRVFFIWDGWDLLYERHQDLNGNLLFDRKYMWGPDIVGGAAGRAGGLLLMREKRGQTTKDYYPLYDGSGHVVGLADAAGELVAEYWYGPFGELIKATGEMADANPWRYATKYCDRETGLCYFGHRYYDPVTGQWLNREPLGESESLNLYSYCHNDPVNHVDRIGLSPYELQHQLATDRAELRQLQILYREALEAGGFEYNSAYDMAFRAIAVGTASGAMKERVGQGDRIIQDIIENPENYPAVTISAKIAGLTDATIGNSRLVEADTRKWAVTENPGRDSKRYFASLADGAIDQANDGVKGVARLGDYSIYGKVAGAIGFTPGDLANRVLPENATPFADRGVYEGEGAQMLGRFLSEAGLLLIPGDEVRYLKYGDDLVRIAPRTTRFDYSRGFADDLINFNPGATRFSGKLDDDLLIVSYHADVPLGQGRTAKWWTTPAQGNSFSTVDEVVQGLALPPDWGARNVVSVARIPKGTPVEYHFGTARRQLSKTGEEFMGNGLQFRFREFDPAWILQTRKLP